MFEPQGAKRKASRRRNASPVDRLIHFPNPARQLTLRPG